MKSLFSQQKDGPIEGQIKITPIAEKREVVTKLAKTSDQIRAELNAALISLENEKIDNQKLSTSTNKGVVVGLDKAIQLIKGILND